MRPGFRWRRTPPPWLYPYPVDGAPNAADEALLHRLQKAAFDYFAEHTHPSNGLVSDASRDGSPSSIAAVGFALSAYPVGVERDRETGLRPGTDRADDRKLSKRIDMATDSGLRARSHWQWSGP